MLLIILGFLCAVLLSVRFDMFILLPATLMGWGMAAIGGVLGGGSLGSILLQMMLVTVALQAGYMAGIVGQWLMGSKRTVPVRWRDESAAAATPDKAF